MARKNKSKTATQAPAALHPMLPADQVALFMKHVPKVLAFVARRPPAPIRHATISDPDYSEDDKAFWQRKADIHDHNHEASELLRGIANWGFAIAGFVEATGKDSEPLLRFLQLVNVAPGWGMLSFDVGKAERAWSDIWPMLAVVRLRLEAQMPPACAARRWEGHAGCANSGRKRSGRGHQRAADKSAVLGRSVPMLSRPAQATVQ